MATTFTGLRVQDTYNAILKIGDNSNLSGTAKILSDGVGNSSSIYLSTTRFGIGITPAYQFHTTGNAKIGGDVIISGDLTVNGDLTYLNVTDLQVEDPLIKLAKDNTSNTLDIGFFGKYVESATTKYTGLFWDASTDKFRLYEGLQVEPTTTVDVTGTGYTRSLLNANLEGNVTGTVSSLSNHDTNDLVEGSVNLYYTNARADARVNLQTGVNLDLSNKDTDDLSEGSTNLYFTTARARASFSAGDGITITNGVIASEGDAEVAKRIDVTVKNVSGGSLAKGVVVHASPSATPPSGNVIEVVAADANVAASMPAIGVLNETIADEAEGEAVMFGALSGIDTSSFTSGDELYVSETAGAFTATKPTAFTSQVQKIAIVLKVHASNGSIKVFGAGRANDVPNRVDRDMNFTDDSELTFGDSSDLKIYHTTNNIVRINSGDLIFNSFVDDGDIKFQLDNGSDPAGLTEYMRLDGGEQRIIYGRSPQMVDNLKLYFGNDTANDASIKWDSTASQLFIDGESKFLNDLYVVGDIIGNLTGDVTGNLTGNVTGSVTGAASLNVLKAGDTMTGTLQINSNASGEGSNLKIYSTTQHQYPQIFSDSTREAMWNYKNDTATWYVGLRNSTQLISATSAFAFYNTSQGVTVGGYSLAGDHYAKNSSRSKIFYDLDNVNFYYDPATGSQQQYTYNVSGSSGNYGSQIIAGQTSVDLPYTLQDSNHRPILAATGAYPVLHLNHTSNTNANHGPTIQFTHNGVTDDRQWVFGSTGDGISLDIGFSSDNYQNPNDNNPHNGISGYRGKTYMRFRENGNIGLGASNGGWGGISGGNPAYAIDTKGTLYNNTDVRAPIFYDSDDINYYLNPASTSNLNSATFAGAVRAGTGTINTTYGPAILNSSTSAGWGSGNLPYIGSNNSSSTVSSIFIHNIHATFRTDNYRTGATGRAGVRMAIDVSGSNWWDCGLIGDEFEVYRNSSQQRMLVIDSSGNVTGLTSLRSPIFYDTNDTTYFVNPASNGSRIKNLVIVPQSESWSEGIRFDMPTQGVWGGLRWSRAGAASNAANWALGYAGDESTDDMLWYSGTGNHRWRLNHSGDNSVQGSFRAPIFYDSDNTGYYLNAASTSNLNAVAINGSLTVAGDAVFSGDVYGKSVNAAYSQLYRFGGIFFTWDSDTYGTNIAHSITSTHNGVYGDNITMNSYGKVRINFDSNNNDSADFSIGTHTTGASNTLLALDSAGSCIVVGDVRSPLFYDSSNTNYYLDPASNNYSLRINGGIQTNAANGNVIIKHTVSEANSWLFQENAANWGLFWLNEGANGTVFGSYTTVGAEFIGFRQSSNTNFKNPSAWTGINSTAYAGWLLSNYSGYFWTASTQYSETDMRAPIFYDSNNTGYFVNPASGTEIYDLTLKGPKHTYIKIDPTGNYESMVRYMGASGGDWYVGKRTSTSSSASGISTSDYHFYSATAGKTVGGVTSNGGIHAQYFGFTVGDPAATYTYNDTSTRGKVYVSSQYPVITINVSNTANAAHGGTLQFVASGYDSNAQWVIGSGGTCQFLDFGFGQPSNKNPHVGINGYQGKTMMRMIKSGKVGIGGNWGSSGSGDPSYDLDVLGTIRASSDVIAFSDKRVKENIKTIDNALEKVTKLRGVSYTRKDIEDKSTKVGVIAQEVLEILPEVVNQDDKGMYSVAYGNIVGVLIEAVKEQQKQINELTNIIDKLNK